MFSRHPALPAQADFRAIDRAGRGLTTVVMERALMPGADLDVLARAVPALGIRHEALRTTVEWARDADHSGPESLWRGFQNVVAEHATVVLEQGVQPERKLRADPSQLPVFRFQVLTDDAGATFRVITDHALCDRWSLLVLYRDLELFYDRELESGERPVTGAYPFSRFIERRYGQWCAGEFQGAIRSVGERICAAQPPTMGQCAGLPARPFTRAYQLSLGNQSSRRFEAIRARARSTRFAVALALFFTTLHAVFGWRDCVALVPVANRPYEALGSVGLFADSHYVICRIANDLYDVTHEIARSLGEAIRGSSPPAALVRERPALRELLAAYPRVTGDVLYDVLPGEPSRHRARLFAADTAEAEPTDDDVIEDVAVPLFPAQPDLRLSCSFSEQLCFSVHFRVDRVPAPAALSVAEGILETIRKAS